MSILRFTPQDHSYTSISQEDNTKWISVTSFISNFKQPFDADKIAEKTSKSRNKSSRYKK